MSGGSEQISVARSPQIVPDLPRSCQISPDRFYSLLKHQGSYCWRSSCPLGERVPTFGRSSCHFWQRVRTFGRSSCHWEQRLRTFGRSSCHFGQRVRTFGAPAALTRGTPFAIASNPDAYFHAQRLQTSNPSTFTGFLGTGFETLVSPAAFWAQGSRLWSLQRLF